MMHIIEGHNFVKIIFNNTRYSKNLTIILTYGLCNHKIHRSNKLELVDNTWEAWEQNQHAHPISSKMD